MNIETITLTIPGLTRRYTFYHTSDCHIAHALEHESQQAKELAEKQIKMWSRNGVTPCESLENALRTINKDSADGLLLCGDAADYMSEGCLARLKELLSRCNAEILYVCGNHERSRVEPQKAAQRAFYPSYQDMMPGSPDLWVRDFSEFLIVGVDDGDKDIREEQLAGLQRLFALNKPILLLIHIPIMTESIIPAVKEKWGDNGPDYFLLGKPEDTPLSRRFCEILRDPDNPIKAVFAGHIHLSHAGELAPGRMQYTSAPTFEGTIRKVILTAEE